MPISHTASGVVQLPRVPNSFIGRLLDHGKASADALHLLAIKIQHFDFAGGALNQAHARKAYGVKRPSFRAGIRLLKQTGVLERGQAGRRTFARERLAAHGDGYVLVNPALLKEPSAVTAFALAANLCPRPVPPAEIARRIGITAAGTIRKLAKAAIAGGYVAHATVTRGKLLIGRRGHVFDPVDLVKKVPTKKVPAKNVTTHRDTEDSTEYERNPLQHATRSNERGALVVDLNEDTTRKELGPEWITLKDWRASRFWAERYRAFTGSISWKEWSLPYWEGRLEYYGGAPAHLHQPQAHRQVLEIAHELNALLQIDDVPRIVGVLAFWICEQHARGKPIRSLGLVAEKLARRCEDGDDSWLYDIPTRLPQAEFKEAAELAATCVDALKNYGFGVSERILLCTGEVERLALMIRKSRHDFVLGVNHATSHGLKPAEGHSICGWHWFDQHIRVAVEANKIRHAASTQQRKKRGRAA